MSKVRICQDDWSAASGQEVQSGKVKSRMNGHKNQEK